MKKDIALVVHTNTEYHDVMRIFDRYLNKYFPLEVKKYIITNNPYDNKKYTSILYDNNKIYSERILESMETIEEENVLFLHEDMILYDFVKVEEIKNILVTLKEDNVDYIKLIKTGNDELIEYKKNLYRFPKSSESAFAIQPTIWKKSSLIKLLSSSGKKTIWQLEEEMQRYCLDNFLGLYWFDVSSKKRGAAHWDSEIFPYIATAIVKGKWNILEYKKELLEIQAETGLNFFIRGIFL